MIRQRLNTRPGYSASPSVADQSKRDYPPPRPSPPSFLSPPSPSSPPSFSRPSSPSAPASRPDSSAPSSASAGFSFSLPSAFLSSSDLAAGFSGAVFLSSFFKPAPTDFGSAV